MTACNQKGCTEPAVARFHWPGNKTNAACGPHVEKARGIAEAMGFELVVLPIEERALWSVTPDQRAMLEAMGQAIAQRIGAGIDQTDLRGHVGFCVLLYTFEPGFLTHVANGQRADVAKMLREYADVLERHAESKPIAELNS